jgi:hypothetical protein
MSRIAARHSLFPEYTGRRHAIQGDTFRVALTLSKRDAILGSGRKTMRRSPGRTAGEVKDGAVTARPTPPVEP